MSLSARVLVVFASLAISACALDYAPLDTPRGSSPTLALDAASSSLSFTGIKNNSVAVPGKFAGLTGQIDVGKRSAWIEVDVASLATGDPARDTNITTHFFEVAKFATARFEVMGIPPVAQWPTAGGSVALDLAGRLKLHGTELDLSLPVRLVGEAGGGLRVISSEPIILTAKALGLERQLQILKAVCGHSALSGAVPIQFDVAFAG